MEAAGRRPAAGARAGPDLAGAHAAHQLADGLAGAVELLVEVGPLAEVVVEEVRAELVAQLARQHAARAALGARERHVDAAGRLQAHQLAHGDHVDGGLEAVLLLPLVHRVRRAAALVVADERVVAPGVDPVDDPRTLIPSRSKDSAGSEASGTPNFSSSSAGSNRPSRSASWRR